MTLQLYNHLGQEVDYELEDGVVVFRQLLQHQRLDEGASLRLGQSCKKQRTLLLATISRIGATSIELGSRTRFFWNMYNGNHDCDR